MKEYILKDLLKIKNGKDHKNLPDGDIPVYGSGGLMRYVNECIYDEESILLPRKGSLDNIQYVNKPFWTVDTIYYTIVDKTKANPYFLYNYLNLLDLSNLDSGTGVPSMTFDSYYNIKVKLPDLTTQKSIAKVLSDLDAKIELNNRINEELESLAKTIYDYWFVQFDFPFDFAQGDTHDFAQGKPNQDGKPYKSSGGKMVYNEKLKREIPEGWEVKIIGDYCPSIGGFAFKSDWWTDKGNQVVKIKDIQEDFTIDLNNLSFVELSDKKIEERFIAKPGNVLIAMTGATIGKYAIVPYTDENLYVNQRVGQFDLGDNPIERLPFLLNSLKQEYFRDQVFLIASGAAQPNISNEQINNIPLILPNEKIIGKYNKTFEHFYRKILNNLKQNQELSALRDWLLPMLMNGQVRVGEGQMN